jgi:hypothetical protein
MQPAPWWATIVAVAVGAVLAGGANEWQRRQQGRSAANKEREAAYIALLIESFMFVHRAQVLGLVKQFRSGLQEGVGLLLRQRKPIDALDFMTRFVDDAAPLYDAYSRIWLHGSQRAMDAADELLSSSASMLTTLTSSDSGRPLLLKLLAGEGWSKAQEQAYDQALARVSERRVTFAKVVRKELGKKTVEFALERAKKVASSRTDPQSDGR